MLRVKAGDLIKTLKSVGLTREDIASRLKVSVSAVRSWEKESRRPNWATLQLLRGLLVEGGKRGRKKDEHSREVGSCSQAS